MYSLCDDFHTLKKHLLNTDPVPGSAPGDGTNLSSWTQT